VLMRILTEEELALEQAEKKAMAKIAAVHAGLEPLAVEMDSGQFPKRLQERFVRIIEAMSSLPEKSFPRMTGSVGELVALYRFLGNFRVTPDKILEPHVLATCDRADRLGRILVVHDTSGISYGGQGTREGLGPLNDGGQGYYLHPSLAVSADGMRVPLGVLRFEALVREALKKDKKPKNSRKKDPDSAFERWWRGVEQSEQLFEGSGTELLHVMDREGDDFVLEARMLGAGKRFVIRSSFDRLLSLTAEENKEGAARKLREALAQAEVVFEREVELSPRKEDRSAEKRKTYPARKGRIAKLCAAARGVSIRRPNGLGSIDEGTIPGSIQLNVVRVWEVEAPEGVEPVQWYLLTSEPIEKLEQILEVIDFYRARWVIEELFKALKSGCSLEKRQLESKEALLNALAVFLPIACRMLLLRSLARSTPALPATVVLSPTQIHILRTMRPKAALSPQPSVGDALLAIASLGGHLKHNGDPGWQVIGRGFEKIVIVEEYLASIAPPDAGAEHISDNLISIRDFLASTDGSLPLRASVQS
jgi:transposase-like protein/DDE family transposase